MMRRKTKAKLVATGALLVTTWVAVRRVRRKVNHFIGGDEEQEE